MPLVLTLALTALGCGGQAQPSRAQPTEPVATTAAGVRLVSVGHFSSPLYVTAPRTDRARVFVVEQGGTIAVVKNGHRLAKSFLDIRRNVTAGGEQGLLS